MPAEWLTDHTNFSSWLVLWWSPYHHVSCHGWFLLSGTIQPHPSIEERSPMSHLLHLIPVPRYSSKPALSKSQDLYGMKKPSSLWILLTILMYSSLSFQPISRKSLQATTHPEFRAQTHWGSGQKKQLPSVTLYRYLWEWWDAHCRGISATHTRKIIVQVSDPAYGRRWSSLI